MMMIALIIKFQDGLYNIQMETNVKNCNFNEGGVWAKNPGMSKNRYILILLQVGNPKYCC